MSVQEARAYAMACELHRLLGELCEQPQNGPGFLHGGGLGLDG